MKNLSPLYVRDLVESQKTDWIRIIADDKKLRDAYEEDEDNIVIGYYLDKPKIHK